MKSDKGKKFRISCLIILLIISISWREINITEGAKTKYQQSLEFRSRNELGILPTIEQTAWILDEENKRIFINIQKGFAIINISNPENPELIITYNFEVELADETAQVHCFAYKNNFLFIRKSDRSLDPSNKFWIFNVTDSNHPEFFSEVESEYLYKTDLFYFLKKDENILVGTGNDYLNFWDVSDPATPVHLSRLFLSDILAKPKASIEATTLTVRSIIEHPVSSTIMIYISNLLIPGEGVNLVMIDHTNLNNPFFLSYTPPNGGLFEHYKAKYAVEIIGDKIVIFGLDGFQHYIVTADWSKTTRPELIDKMPLNIEGDVMYNQKMIVHKNQSKILLYKGLTSLLSLENTTENGFLSEPMYYPDGMFSTIKPLCNNEYVYSYPNTEIDRLEPLKVDVWKITNNTYTAGEKRLPLIISTSIVGGLLLIPIAVFSYRKFTSKI